MLVPINENINFHIPEDSIFSIRYFLNSWLSTQLAANETRGY